MIFAETLLTIAPVQGTLNFLADATTLVMWVSLPATALLAGFFLFQKSHSDEMDQKVWMKRVRNAVICGISILISSSVLNAIFAYYK